MAKPVLWTAAARLKPPPNNTKRPQGTFCSASFHSSKGPGFSLFPLGTRNNAKAAIIAIPESERPLRKLISSNKVLNIQPMAVKKKIINIFNSAP